MDFFSRLFSSSDNKKPICNNIKEHDFNQPLSKTDSTPSAKLHESGTFCRESRVDQIESPFSSILTTSSDNDQRTCEGLASSSSIITRTLDCWNPETCVRLLRMPSVQNYSGLRKLISKSDRNWMIEFLQMGGLEVLFESVDRLSSKKFTNSSRLEHTLLLLQCVSCLKAVTDSHIALEFIIQQKTYAKKIAEVLCSENPLVKKQLFEFMSTLCVFSEDGHYLTLDVFECYRVRFKLRYRFAILIIEIKQAEVMPYVGSVLGLINCIILGACGFRFRTRIRNELLALGLQDLLESLKEISEEEVQLQCSVFMKSQLADEEYARSMGIRSSFSHFALFQALLDKIEDTPLSASFIVLLQNLNHLDPTDSKTDYVWSILEEITERAITGAGSVLRNWMLGECRRSSMKSTSTQTSFFMPHTLTLEDHVAFGKVSMCDEDYEKDSVKSFSSRDSGMPVSRNQSFASSGPRSPQSTLPKQNIENTQIANLEKDFSEGEFSNTVKNMSIDDISNTAKGSSDDEFSNTVKESFKNIPVEVSEKHRTSSGFFKTVGLSFTFMNSASNKTQIKPSEDQLCGPLPENIPLSLRSESPIPQNDILVEEFGKTKKTFTFPFFTRSKKYSLAKCPPKVKINPPSPDMQIDSRQAVSPASSRDGMTSMDVKRSRKQMQLSNSILHDDNSSVTSGDKDTLSSETASSTFEFYENYPDVQLSPISRSFSITEEGNLHDSNEQLNHLSKSTSYLTQVIPPPPPPPPPPSTSPVAFRSQTRTLLGLPSGAGIRSSWSGNPTVKEVDETEKRLYNTLPRPKSKMKTLNWAKIPSSHVSVHSIWSEIESESKGMELNFEEMEKLFCQDQPVKKERKPDQKQRPTSEVSLLGSKRSLSIAVFLKQFKGGLEEVVEYVRMLKHKEIGAERLRTLLNLLPEANEVNLLNSYSGDMNRLGTAEKFILRLNAVECYDCRIEGMLLLEEFPTTIQILHDAVQSLLDACQELLTNKGFKNFLKLVLLTGNFMNSGSYAGNAMGFRLSTLPKLMETRANRPRITLLHYLVEEFQRKDSESLKFTNELLDKLNRCSRLTLENLCTEITQLDKTLDRLNSRLETENGQLKKHFSGFIENGMKHLTILKKKMGDIKSISVQLANRFCEDEKKFQLEECLSVVSVFCSKIKMADSENQARKMAEERKQSTGNKTGNESQLPSRTWKTSTM